MDSLRSGFDATLLSPPPPHTVGNLKKFCATLFQMGNQRFQGHAYVLEQVIKVLPKLNE